MRKVQFNGVGHLSQPFELLGTDSSENLCARNNLGLEKSSRQRSNF